MNKIKTGEIETNGFQFRDQRNNIDSKQLILYLGHFDCCPVLLKVIIIMISFKQLYNP